MDEENNLVLRHLREHRAYVDKRFDALEARVALVEIELSGVKAALARVVNDQAKILSAVNEVLQALGKR